MKYSIQLLLGCTIFALAATAGHADDAKDFGARESIEDISIAPDGSKVAYLQPAAGTATELYVADVAAGTTHAVTRSDGKQWDLRWCAWVSSSRLICQLYGRIDTGGSLLAFTRLIALDADGGNVKALGQRQSSRSLGVIQFDGEILGWPADDSGSVIMARAYVPETSIGTHLSSSKEGLGVDLVDTLTLKTKVLEQPHDNASDYIADTKGQIRVLQNDQQFDDGVLRGTSRFLYRPTGSKDWKPFSTVSDTEKGLYPLAVDGERNIVYAFKNKDGRNAVYSVSMDGKMTETLLAANERVDISNLVRFGRTGRIIGAQFITDKRETTLFDAEYAALASKLHKALPGLPLVSMVDASRDESKILMFAGSDSDPGRYYLFDKTTNKLNEIALARPNLENHPLASVKMVEYVAADGTKIPAYLTLPPGSDGKGLPAIVMPHGGPSSRDEWGFDWLAQFYAAKGYAVFQPNFRGSSGYGDDWYGENGFKSWKLAVGDVNDAGRWLVSQGIANPSRLGVVGWSYGGYAALQSSALDPDLYKAIVAIAPVTDLALLVTQAQDFTNSRIVADFVGTGSHVKEGSPLQQVDKIKAPVLLFSGDEDLNVDISHSRQMESALKKRGATAELVTYPGLDHQLADSTARADMLARSASFLDQYLKAN